MQQLGCGCERLNAQPDRTKQAAQRAEHIPMSVKPMKAGAIDFLTKPVREQEMLDAVTGAIERDRKRRDEEKPGSEARARFALLTPR